MESSEKVQNLPLISSNSIRTRTVELNLYRDVFKRVFDLFLAILLLPVVIPILLLLIILIKIDSRGPAIYQSERIGRHGKKFSCLKLRTMCINADEKLEQLLSTDAKLKEEWSNDHKLKNDPRVTKVGKIMRALSLDELPQIFNVLRGEMSFVGPRPIVEEEIRKYNNNFSAYKSIRPGITGLWQINGRNDTDYSIRVKMDTTYAGSLNYFSDMAILFKTIPAILSTRGAY